ncbi:hypothetical protein MSG28_000797 [Choristoneura fumiferana]|uniref:Uncharacterized protein n=1 Tax=Choristoneura fumiferana TaxID=7141 RepID=A0ACC0K2I2_CHOFU|nr:hypothetical protein MSG28_000797 [Choristoneura fumiferana]
MRIEEYASSKNYIFAAFAVETGSVEFGRSQTFQIKKIKITNDHKAGAFLTQRIGITIQRGNEASLMGALPQGQDLGEFCIFRKQITELIVLATPANGFKDLSNDIPHYRVCGRQESDNVADLNVARSVSDGGGNDVAVRPRLGHKAKKLGMLEPTKENQDKQKNKSLMKMVHMTSNLALLPQRYIPEAWITIVQKAPECEESQKFINSYMYNAELTKHDRNET